MTECVEVEDLLAARVLGAVDEAEMDRVDGHLHGCQACRAVARMLAERVAMLVAEAPTSSALWDRIIGEVDQFERSRIARSRGRRTWSKGLHEQAEFGRVMIPERFPAASGWAIAAAYDSADGQLFMTGDFYDVYALPDGGVAVVVGDVSSAGPEGATIALSIRNALRTALWLEPDPVRAVTAMETILADELLDAWVRMTIIAAPPDGETVRVLSVGGAEPWLLGAAAPVSVPRSSPLGIATERSRQAGEVLVERGEALLLFSQGVMETWRNDDGGHVALVELLRSKSPQCRSHEFVLRLVDLARSVALPKSDLVVVALTRDA